MHAKALTQPSALSTLFTVTRLRLRSNGGWVFVVEGGFILSFEFCQGLRPHCAPQSGSIPLCLVVRFPSGSVLWACMSHEPSGHLVPPICGIPRARIAQSSATKRAAPAYFTCHSEHLVDHFAPNLNRLLEYPSRTEVEADPPVLPFGNLHRQGTVAQNHAAVCLLPTTGKEVL